MSNSLRLCIFTLVLAITSGSLRPFSLTFTQVMAACLLEGQTNNPPVTQGDVITVSEDITSEGPGNGPAEEPPSGNTPISGQTVICEGDIDKTGVFSTDPPEGSGQNGSNITVTVKGPDGGIEVSEDRPGIFLDSGAVISIEGPNRPVTTTGDGAPAIRVLDNATITVQGVVSTAGEDATGIQAGSVAKITIDGGEVSTTGEGSEAIRTRNGADIDLSDESTITTVGTEANAITAGVGSAIDLVGTSQISTSGDRAHTIVINGATSSTISIGAGTSLSTQGSIANAIQINRAAGESTSTGSAVDISGTVNTTGTSSAAITSNADNLNVTVNSGGVVSTQGSSANGIQITSPNATVTVSANGEVSVVGTSAAAISTASNSTVNVSGTVSTAGVSGQGVVIGDGSSVTVENGGKVTAASSNAQAIAVDENASSANVTVAAGGQIESAGQAIAASGDTSTNVVIDGSISGSGSAPTVSLGNGADTVTVNGTVRNMGSERAIATNGGNDTVEINGTVNNTANSAAIDTGSGNDTVTVNGTVASISIEPVIMLGDGDDTLNDNSSQTISGPGLLASAGSGSDTLNLHNGKVNDSANYDSFETIDVAQNTTPGDPANGNGTTLNVTNDLSGSTINVRTGSQVNVQDGGTINLRADGSPGGGSGQQGGSIAFADGSAANVQTENRTGSQPTQVFSNTTFAAGTSVNTSSNFVRGTVSNNSTTGNGEIVIQSDFTNRLMTENAQRFGAALNAVVDSGILSAEQQAALDDLIARAPNADEAEAVISQFSGEVKAQGAAGAVQAATLFNNSLTPSGTRVDSRRSPISIISETPDNPLNDTSAVGNGGWISGLASLISADDNDSSTEFDSNTYGIAVGYDRAISNGDSGKAVFGVGAGYSGTGVDGVRDSADVTTYSVGAYFDGNSGPFAANVAASYSSQTIESPNSEDSSGGLFVTTAEGFYNLRQGSTLAVGPIGRLNGAFGSYSGFDTDSETFGTSYDSADVSQLMAGLGVRVGGQSQVDLGLLSLNLDVLYETALSDTSLEYEGQLAGNSVGIAAPFANDSGFYIGAEAALAVSERSSLGFRYQGNLGDNVQSHTGEIKFSILF